jgi:hypothetical protein
VRQLSALPVFGGPTVEDLIGRVIDDTDFLRDLNEECDIPDLAADALQLAYDNWCDDTGRPNNVLSVQAVLSRHVIDTVMTALNARALVALDRMAVRMTPDERFMDDHAQRNDQSRKETV